jgi:osmotically-inducible protein OsmY
MASRSRQSDAQVTDEVRWELQRDARLKDASIAVDVSHGLVTLTGTVPSDDAKAAAQAAAHRVAGVLDVANDVQVSEPDRPPRTDREIARAIRETIEADASLSSGQIRTTVANGWVTIAGVVDTFAQREEAEFAVRRLAAVRGVTNRMTVKSPITYQEI